MKIVVRNKILIALSVLLVLTVLSFALTEARYSGEKQPGNHTGELDYTIANQIEVATTEQFFAAVANGYSNIKIADSVSNPFLVTGSADVTSDLILDMNGHQIQRNSREPMLTIKAGVKMIVTDTSRSQTGSFYNPVGSVLKIDGGVLTVMSNTFESGPRNDEYFSNRNKTAAHNGLQYVGGRIAQSATLDVKTKGASAVSTENVPILLPYVAPSEQGAVTGGTKYFVNGNIYFDKAIADYKDSSLPSCNADLVTADTYFYFTIDDQNASSSAIVASTDDADFSYSYYIKRDGTAYSYAGATEATGGIKVTIYGYKNVIASARNEVAPYDDPETPSNFAAIKMINGSMYSRGGKFFSYFGVETSSCIYADEGSLSVYDGSYTALDEGVAVRCYYLLPDSEFTILGGTFKSFKGDTIHMRNGEMTITGGTFVKDSSAYSDEGNPGDNNNNSAIKLDNGSIFLNSTETTPINFYLAGKFMAAIECGAQASIESDGVNYQFGTTNGSDTVPGGNNIGILCKGGDVDVYNSTFIQPGDYSYGIYSYDETDEGTHHTLDVVASVFSMGGERCTGIYADGGTINIGRESDLYQPKRDSTVYNSNGDPKVHKVYNNGIPTGETETAKGISIDNYTMFYLDHVANCYGVYVEKAVAGASTYAAATTINVYAGQFSIGSGYYYDITGQPHLYTEAEVPGAPRLDGNGNYVAYTDSGPIETEVALQEAEKVWSAGVYLNDTSATVNLGRVRMIVGGSYAAGIFAEQGIVDKLYKEEIDKRYNGTTMEENDLPTTVFFIGTRMLGYQNGGYLKKDADEKAKKWNHLYKLDLDYYQTPNFDAYYDRIVNCDSTDDYAIAAKAGKVTMGRAYVNVRSEYSRGIFATSSGSSISQVVLEDLIANIDNKDRVEAADGTVTYVNANVLNTTTMTIRNGNVTIDDADIRTNGVGIVINNGKLTCSGNVNLQAVNASALYMTSTAMVSGGTAGPDNNWTINENAKVTIFCNIRERTKDDGTVDLTMPIPWKLKNVHSRGETVGDGQLPTDSPNKTNENCMLSYNGVNIKGGSVTCGGELNVDFHGVNNDNQNKYDPYNIPLAGCAINVEHMTGSDAPRVSLWHAHVTSGRPKSAYTDPNETFYNNKDDISDSNAGGGISVKGGDVTIGRSDPTFYTDSTQKGYQVLHERYNGDYNKMVTIATMGNTRYGNTWFEEDGEHKHYNYLSSPKNDNWSYAVSQTGGPGIKVESGDIIVRYGTYYAAQGNGILLVGGEATVHNGIFKGKNTEWNFYVNKENDSTGSGLGSFYGFMLRGGGKLTINGGTFEGFNGGAFIVGSKSTNGTINTAEAYVYGGTFEDMPERRSERFTTNGFSVGPYSKVVIGKETKSADAPSIIGIACGIAVENNATFKDGFSDVFITVQGGTVVKATKGPRSVYQTNAIWKGNKSATLRFGECTLWRQTTESDFSGYVIDGEENLWNQVVDVSKFHVYEYPNPAIKGPYEARYDEWKAQGGNAYQLIITAEDKNYPQGT